MNIVLRQPTDEACKSFDAVLTDPFYYSDASEDGDVNYTSDEPSDEAIKTWIEQAKTQKIIDDAEILDW